MNQSENVCVGVYVLCVYCIIVHVDVCMWSEYVVELHYVRLKDAVE